MCRAETRFAAGEIRILSGTLPLRNLANIETAHAERMTFQPQRGQRKPWSIVECLLSPCFPLAFPFQGRIVGGRGTQAFGAFGLGLWNEPFRLENKTGDRARFPA